MSSNQTNTNNKSTDSSAHVAKQFRRKPSTSLRMLENNLVLKVDGFIDDIFDELPFKDIDEFDSIIEHDVASVFDFWDVIGISLVEKAIELDLIDLVYLLLKHADDSLLIPEQSNALFLSCETNHMELVKVLLKHGADVNEWRNGSEGYETCLHIASRLGHMPLVKLLIEHGALINTVHSGNDSPIIDAAAFGKIEAVRLMLDHGADPNLLGTEADDIGHGAALSCACAHGYDQVAELLLDHGADIDFTNLADNTPFSSSLQAYIGGSTSLTRARCGCLYRQ